MEAAGIEPLVTGGMTACLHICYQMTYRVGACADDGGCAWFMHSGYSQAG